MICNLRLDERTIQIYVSIDIISFDHVIHKNEHIKTVQLAFSKIEFS